MRFFRLWEIHGVRDCAVHWDVAVRLDWELRHGKVTVGRYWKLLMILRYV
jgi:hypothetical protein